MTKAGHKKKKPDAPEHLRLDHEGRPKIGRPYSFTDTEKLDLIEAAFSEMVEGYSTNAACGRVGIYRQRFYAWMKELQDRYPELEDSLSDKYEAAKAARLAFWERRLMTEPGSRLIAPVFALKCAGEPDWQERRRVTLDSHGAGKPQLERVEIVLIESDGDGRPLDGVTGAQAAEDDST